MKGPAPPPPPPPPPIATLMHHENPHVKAVIRARYMTDVTVVGTGTPTGPTPSYRPSQLDNRYTVPITRLYIN